VIDRKLLLADLIKQVKAVEVDLTRQASNVREINERLRAEYERAYKLKRTASTRAQWLGERVTQAAAAWVLGTVFVRFCEDNGLIAEPYLAGPTTERLTIAEELQADFLSADAARTHRDWLLSAFAELGSGQAGKLLFDQKHNALFQIPMSHDAARELIAFWRTRGEGGALVHDFEDGEWDTRFLGDLYQDLSEDARKTYALLQTPVFIEEFILDRTLKPAIGEFGGDVVKMIDPTCGSGHFLLGAFQRLFAEWETRQGHRDLYERVRLALDAVHGVDLNPFAVAIARFRLLVAGMLAAKIATLDEANRYDWPIHIAISDSLIRDPQPDLLGEIAEDDALAAFLYQTEDRDQYPGILAEGSYHVVVGNPPYITVKDKELNKLYRDLYGSCAGKYALSVPFAERFFQLAKPVGPDGRGCGYVGQITSNSFMKREFGQKLIEEYFAHKVELTEVIDTSGAYVPGHGTPTVILVGRRRTGKSRSETVRTVRSVQGEPSAPEDAAKGHVWRAIARLIDKHDQPEESKWISVGNLNRERYFSKHPWILADGGLELIEQIRKASPRRLRDISAGPSGFGGFSGADDAFYLGQAWHSRFNSPIELQREVALGDEVRDWHIAPELRALAPYDNDGNILPIDTSARWAHHLWLVKQQLGGLADFGGRTRFSLGLPWWSWYRWTNTRANAVQTICLAKVASHTHGALNRSGIVTTQHIPASVPNIDITTEQALSVVGLLNSSAGCTWFKQVSYPKGGDPMGGDGARVSTEPWSERFEFSGGNLEDFPLPSAYPTELASEIDILAQQFSTASPRTFASGEMPTRERLREAKQIWHQTRARMIALQEELDWQVYSIYGLLDEDLRAPASSIPELNLGERAFEIVLARRIEAGEATSEWFFRHGSKPIVTLPAHWPDAYKNIVNRRIEVISSSRAIGLIERPEYKRRWATDGWDSLEQDALKSWLLDRAEQRPLWYELDANGNEQPRVLSPAQLADELSRDAEFAQVANLYTPKKSVPETVLALLADEHVPVLSVLRYRDSGLVKRRDWETTWDEQRREDAAPNEAEKRRIRDAIKVPPKYTSADFVRPSYWRARGKLDVPKERFISYGESLNNVEVLGWAGWDHREQAHALLTYAVDREQNHAWTKEQLTPLLAGLLELQPWLTQWHNDFDLVYSGSPAGFFSGFRTEMQGRYGLTDDDLRAWRPTRAAARGRARRS
jgi:hypothetical protein